MTAASAEAACVGKHPYDSASLAHRIAKRASKGRPTVYLCPHCGRHHIGQVAIKTPKFIKEKR